MAYATGSVTRKPIYVSPPKLRFSHRHTGSTRVACARNKIPHHTAEADLIPESPNGTGNGAGAAAPVAASGHPHEAPLAPPPSPPSAVSQILTLLTFSLPTLCIAVTNPLLSLIDTSVVGLSSEVHLAAMAPATMLSDSICYVLTFIPMAVTNLVSLRMARNQPEAAGNVVSQALVLATVISVVLAAVLMQFSPQIISSITAISPEMLQHAAEYVQLRALGLPAYLCYAVLQAFFLACNEPWIPMRATLVAGVVNAVGDLLLCNGFHMGCAGAAIATSAANWVVLLVMLRDVSKPLPKSNAKYANVKVDVGLRVPSLNTVVTFLGISGPILGVIGIKVLMFGNVAARAAEISQVTAAAHQGLFTLNMFIGVFGDTVCQAAQAFLPPLIGRPQEARALCASLMLCGLIVACFNGFISTTLALFCSGAFTSSAPVQQAIAAAAPAFATACALHCCSMGTEGILLASREAWFLMASYAVNLAVVQAALRIALESHLGLVGVWMALVLFHVFRLVVNTLWLLLPRSSLHRTEPLLDEFSAVEDGRAPALA